MIILDNDRPLKANIDRHKILHNNAHEHFVLRTDPKIFSFSLHIYISNIPKLFNSILGYYKNLKKNSKTQFFIGTLSTFRLFVSYVWKLKAEFYYCRYFRDRKKLPLELHNSNSLTIAFLKLFIMLKSKETMTRAGSDTKALFPYIFSSYRLHFLPESITMY